MINVDNEFHLVVGDEIYNKPTDNTYLTVKFANKTLHIFKVNGVGMSGPDVTINNMKFVENGETYVLTDYATKVSQPNYTFNAEDLKVEA